MANAKSSTSKNPFKALVTYIREAREELNKVVWPTKKELRRHTTVVIVISLGVAFFLGALDLLLQRGLQYLL